MQTQQKEILKNMTNRERVIAALNGKPTDRMPTLEWAIWWDQTVHAWEKQGIPAGMDQHQLFKYWGSTIFISSGCR